MSWYSTPRPSAYTSSFSVTTCTNCVEYVASHFRSAAVRRSSRRRTAARWVDRRVPVVVRQMPIPSKFSRENPIGSIRLWHCTQSGRTRWSSIFWRIVGSAALPAASATRGGSGGTSGGGSGGLTPRTLVMIHLPRVTGDVRSGFDVVTRNAPLPSSPRRASMSGPSVTRRN
jgi:hypothetical protein